MSKTLTLHVKDLYFQQIKAGTKTEEYRIFNKFWKKRITGKQFDFVEICSGYPKKGDAQRRIKFPYRAYLIKTITHEFFGNSPQIVFAITLKA